MRNRRANSHKENIKLKCGQKVNKLKLMKKILSKY